MAILDPCPAPSPSSAEESEAADRTWYVNPNGCSWRSTPIADRPYAFHRKLPGYEPTPLVDLPALAADLGIGRLVIKDESNRFGLPAFKILGASWAICRLLSARLGIDAGAATLDRLRDRLRPRCPSPW